MNKIKHLFIRLMAKRSQREGKSIKKSCLNCQHKNRCEAFFDAQYKMLGIKEPERFKNWRCRLYKKAETTEGQLPDKERED